MLASGLRAEAAQFYRDAHRKLLAFQTAHSQWDPQVVRFRLKYLGEKLADLPTLDSSEPHSTPSDSTDFAERNRLMEGQIAALNEQMRQLSADNSLLLSKLREALSARPAEVEPSEVRRAEAKILELQKEKELIELQLHRALNADPIEVDSTQKKKHQAENETLKAQIESLENDLTNSISDADALKKEIIALTAERDQLKEDLALSKNAAASRRAIERLSEENSQLLARLSELQANINVRNQSSSSAELSALMQERDRLKQRVEVLMSEENSQDISQNISQEKMEALMRENAELRSASDANAELKKRLDKLEKENVKLSERLEKARRSRDRGSWFSRWGRKGSREMSILEARLAVLEAEKEPYNADELALLKGSSVSEMQLNSEASSGAASSAELSQAAGRLETEAQAAARKGAFEIAEAKYHQILDLIPNHAPSLASLALTQIKQEKLEEAEANLKMALDISPENTYALFLNGLLKMSQRQFDESVTFLSRAVVLDPDDAEAQNHLGVALTELGHRKPAEVALRKAIRLRPGYAEAHINLAVVYASQNPPFKELAKYHYQQAIHSGHPEVPRIEQLLKSK